MATDASYRPAGHTGDAYDQEGAGGSEEPPRLPSLGLVGTLRWTWRQLTSMRVALLLLMLLAVVAVPGSVLPQRPQDPAAVAGYLADNPTIGPWLDRLGFFDVFASVWFSAVYLLLFLSLIGCILPRVAAHLRGVRARPPRTPRRLTRFPARGEVVLDATPEQVVAAARVALTGPLRALPRFRTDDDVEPDGARTVSAERGYLRETGNLVFHLALLGILVSVAAGQFLHYRGQALVVEGRGFANAVTDYDSFESGTGFDPRSLTPFTLRLDRFTAAFTEDAEARPRDFVADVTVRLPGEQESPRTIRVNHPLTVGEAKIYLQGNGYAPDVVVHDADGEVAFAGAVPFLPEDTFYRSRGVIKVPDVSTGDQVGIVGYLLPTAEVTPLGARSIYPQPLSPLLVLTVWAGDLGLDDGIPQNVYRLDESGMTQALEPDGRPVTLFLEPGQTVDLPDGLGTLTWNDLPRFVALDLRHDPALAWILAFSIAALVGLSTSLFTPRRRLWLRIRTVQGRTVVDGAGLARGDDIGLQGELDRLLDAVRALDPAPSHAPAARTGPTPHDDTSARETSPGTSHERQEHESR
ncbi:cytochrome c biogenesis protein ResB [Actinotalea sp. K2]|uniref:cytochrome c biogenesis protein ResB n=1 Tax=Actinotalea sp. K2 TaxID=2939438 RepID=UPI0020173B40|nr:cytochrome c biogenesis protein ResB [Actinotalea sp. K2]MCL3863055.1 cytochrome c biogenesis protein ResB [Actinotalea sp. K2]